MKKSFMCYIDSATAQKKQFDESVDHVKDSLDKVITESSTTDYKSKLLVQKERPTYSTGWLKGALSYPWAIVCIVIPSILENIH
jgi:hypothetical protein